MKNITSVLRILLTAAFLLIAVDGRAQSAGSLDSTFGTGGIVETYLEVAATLNEMVVQPDGKIVAVGMITVYPRIPPEPPEPPYGACVIRFNSNGSLDTTFNGVGYKTRLYYGDANAVTLQPDGKIVVAGKSLNFNPARIAVTRFNTDGSLDSTFNGGGEVFTPVGLGATASAVSVQPDGKIVIGGFTNLTSTSNRDFAIVRYNTDGSLDTTFGSGGRVATDFNNGSDEIFDTAVQSDGKIVAVGYSTDLLSNTRSATLARYNSDGTLDSSFGSGGKIIKSGPSNSNASEVAIQTDGKIIIVGEGNPPLRYDQNGTLEATFQTAGSNFLPLSVALQPSGKIVVAGGELNPDVPTSFAVARYNSNGSLDTAFGTGGKVITSFPASSFSSSTGALAVAIQPDGKIVAGGTAVHDSHFQIIIARYLNNSQPNRSRMDFDGNGKDDISVFRPSSGIWYTLFNATGNYEAVQFGMSTDKIVPTDYDGDGKTDYAVYRDGIWYLQRSAAGFTSIQFGLATDIPAPADFDGDGRADLAVYRPSNGTWYVLNLANNAFTAVQFGISTDQPVVADYDGDGKTDYAVYRPQNGIWYLLQSTQGFSAVQFGVSTDKAVVGDYDGDGKADEAVYRASIGTWYLLKSTSGFTTVQFGLVEDRPTAADYDGDGKTDISVFRPSNGTWYQLRSTTGFVAQQFGVSEDLPAPNAYVR